MADQRTITYGTKEELKNRREGRFLALSPHERFELFLEMIQESYILFGRTKKSNPNNFIVRKP